MGFHEDAVVPGILRALEQTCLVIKSKVPDDSGPCGIGGTDVMMAADKPMRQRGMAASIVTASLLSAVLASGGTLVALNATGALDRG